MAKKNNFFLQEIIGQMPQRTIFFYKEKSYTGDILDLDSIFLPSEILSPGLFQFARIINNKEITFLNIQQRGFF